MTDCTLCRIDMDATIDQCLSDGAGAYHRSEGVIDYVALKRTLESEFPVSLSVSEVKEHVEEHGPRYALNIEDVQLRWDDDE